jgi:molybdopterin converting factor small subunit
VARAADRPVSITLQHSPILKLKETAPTGRIEVPAGTTAGELLTLLGIHSDHHRYILVYANGRKQGLGYVLRQGDAVQLFLPIGGG